MICHKKVEMLLITKKSYNKLTTNLQ